MVASRISQTWDEGAHIYSGYSYWKRGDFGMNPEHPPLVKLLATVPLMNLPLRTPELQNRNFKFEEFLGGRDFLYRNNADRILFRTRMAASLITLLLGLLIFLAGRELFGTAAGLIALAFFAFDPNFLAHGALVTTDVGVTCFLFAAVYAYYRYKEKPTIARLLLVGLAVGVTFATKHSGILIVPILLALGLAELVRVAIAREKLLRPALRTLAEVLVVSTVSLVVLWAFYGFRYAARPDGMDINPPMTQLLGELHRPGEVRTLSFLSQHHVLPEAYLYGLGDVRKIVEFSHSYLFGKVYAHGVWFYFPVDFVIKCTLPFLLVMVLILAAFARGWIRDTRKIVFLTIPPAIYFGQSMFSGLNLGIRHILPIFPYLFVLGGAALWAMFERDRRWSYVIAALLLFQIVTSARAFPNYLAYSNEAWGGPANTYRYLSDSNADWAQQLKQVHQYLDRHDIKDCWFAYFGERVVDRNYYGVTCKGLPTISTQWLGGETDVPTTIDGTVLISAGVLSGYEFLPDQPNPYESFKKVKPVAEIGDGVFVYEGHFDMSLPVAYHHAKESEMALSEGRIDDAIKEGLIAYRLAPDLPKAERALRQAREHNEREIPVSSGRP